MCWPSFCPCRCIGRHGDSANQDLDEMRARWGFFFGCMESRASETIERCEYRRESTSVTRDSDANRIDRSIDEKLYKRECMTAIPTVQRLPTSNTRILISLLVCVLNLP